MAGQHHLEITAAILSGVLFLGPLATQGQRAAMVGSPRVPIVRERPASTGVVATVKSGARISSSPRLRMHSRFLRNDVLSGGGSLGSFGFADNPGFGLGVSPLANQDPGIKAAIDPATQWRLYEAQKFLRNRGLGGPGYFLLDGGAYYAVPSDSGEGDQAAQQPQTQEPFTIVQAPQTGSASETPAQPEQAETSAPLADSGEFVLALRNGDQIQAVAFTRSGDRIVYITIDGSRRTVGVADLDTDATVRINGEQGTPLQFPL